ARVGRVAVDDELEDGRAGRDDVARLAAVVLLEPVDQEDLVADPVPAEIDHDLDTFRRRNTEAPRFCRAWQQVAGGADLDEVLPRAQEELIEACVRAIQEPEAILAPRHLQEGLDFAVDEELVAQEAVVVEVVEDEEALAVEEPVLHDHRDVELAARQAESRR